jgi:hypothetical protein
MGSKSPSRLLAFEKPELGTSFLRRIPGTSELRDAYVLLPFLSKPHEEEDSEADQRYEKKGAAKNQIRSFGSIRRLVKVFVEENSPGSQADHSHKQKQILHGPSCQR